MAYFGCRRKALFYKAFKKVFPHRFYTFSPFIKIIGTNPIFSKMDYSAVSQAAKRFKQKSKVNHKIGEIKQKMMVTLREN
jgi:hypothetical protein